MGKEEIIKSIVKSVERKDKVRHNDIGEWKKGCEGLQLGYRYDVMCEGGEVLNDVKVKCFLDRDGEFVFHSKKGKVYHRKTNEIEKNRVHIIERFGGHYTVIEAPEIKLRKYDEN